MQKVKGNPLYQYKRFVIERYGDEGMEKLLSKTRKETKELFEGIIDVHAWFNMEIFCDFMEAFDKTFGREKFNELARYTVEKQIGGLFGLVMRFVDVETLFARAQEFWDKFYSPGKVWAGRVGPEIVLKVEDFELSELQAIGFMLYIKGLIEMVEKKEFISSFKKQGKKTTEFHYLEKVEKS